MAARDSQPPHPRQTQGHTLIARQEQQDDQEMAEAGQVLPRPDQTEGVVTRTIEHYAAQLPSDTFLWAAAGSMGLSLCCRLAGNKHDALFFGQCVPSLLILGLYHKLVKVAGSDPQRGSQIMAGRGAGI